MTARPDVDDLEKAVGFGSWARTDGMPRWYVEEVPACRPGDRAVQLAFALGWHMAELHHAEALSDPPRHSEEPPPERLPGFSVLGSHQRVEMYLAQVDELASRLCGLPDLFGASLPTRHVRA
jgi:hypothetical protein